MEFSTYATPAIVGEIKRHFRTRDGRCGSARLQELKLALTKAIGDLAQREGRAPTIAEIAARLQMTEEEVLEGLESANACSTVSLDAPDSGDDDAAVAESLGVLDEALGGRGYGSRSNRCWSSCRRGKSDAVLRFFGNIDPVTDRSELGISRCTCRGCWQDLTDSAGLTADD